MKNLKKYLPFLLLVALGLALGAYVYFHEIKGKAVQQQAAEEAKKLFTLTASQVGKLQIQFKEEDYTLSRIGMSWHFTEPLKALAKSNEVDRLLDRVFELKRVVEIGRKVETLKDFGLAPAGLTISFWSLEGNFINTLFFGDRNPAHDNVYVMTQTDSIVLLVTAGVLYNVQKKMFDLRDRDLCSFERDEISRVRLARGKGVLDLLKKADRAWYLERPVKARAQRTTVNKVLDRLVYNKAEEYVAEEPQDLRPYGLKEPWFTVTIYSQPETSNVLLVGKKVAGKDFYHAKRQDRPAVFYITGYCVENLNQSLEGVRDTVLVDFRKQDITTLHLANGASRLDISKQADGTWQAGTNAGEGFNRQVEELVEAMEELAWKAIVTDKARELAGWGLDKRARKVEIGLSSGITYTVLFGNLVRQQDSTFYCKMDGSESIYMVNKEPVIKMDQIVKPVL